METRGDFDYFVGIDISKDKFDACGIRKDETKHFQISTAMDRTKGCLGQRKERGSKKSKT